jgi:hypothetical protein
VLGQLITARAWTASFEQIIGQEADMSTEGRIGDRPLSGGDLDAVGTDGSLGESRLAEREKRESNENSSH